MQPIPLSLLPHIVTVAPWASDDAYGTPTYGAAVSYQHCRIEYVYGAVRNATGATIPFRGKVIIGGASIPTVNPKDKLTLPDGATPPIVAVSRFDGPDGAPHHAEVVFG